MFPLDISAFTDISVRVNDKAVVGETIIVDYTITSTESKLPPHIVFIECVNAPLPLLSEEPTMLRSDEDGVYNYHNTYTYLTVDDTIEPQSCKARVSLSDNVNGEIISSSADFQIVTNPSFELEINFCEDINCIKKSKVFYLDDIIYLNYDTSVSQIENTAILTSPFQSKKQLTLPTTIKAEQIGTYNLDVIVSKPGYKTITKKQQFAVIEKPAEIKFISKCNEDGICNNKETQDECPQDCHLKQSKSSKISDKISKFSSEKWNIYTLYLILGIIIITICLILRGFIRKNNNK